MLNVPTYLYYGEKYGECKSISTGPLILARQRAKHSHLLSFPTNQLQFYDAFLSDIIRAVKQLLILYLSTMQNLNGQFYRLMID